MNNKTGRKRVRRARKNESIKRILLTICMMAMIAAVSIGGTIAWLTDYTPEVKNVFTPTNIDIELNETTTNYVMIPGGTIKKDPTITINKDSESLWLFVKMDKANDFDKFMEYTMASDWEKVDENDDTLYFQKLDAPFADPTSIQVIENDTVTVKSTVTKEMMDKLYDDVSENKDLHPSLTVTAYAIQQANLGEGATAADAWQLLTQQGLTYEDPNELPFGTQTTTTGGEENNGEG